MKEKNILHIINGDSLTAKFNQLRIPGDKIIWREMLCEGPTLQELGSKRFSNLRKKYLKENYGISETDYEDNFLKELEKLSAINHYDEIVLWFEFDLFSHINMIALISFLLQKGINIPIYLVCSARLEGETELLPLSELPVKQLQNHYQCRINLDEDDLEMANLIWELYCGDKPMRLASEIRKTTNFEYLASCMRAHIERFPNAKTGLNALEFNLLQLIDEHEIKSLNQLLGYALKYQGYYGYGDRQMQRVMEKTKIFYLETSKEIKLNESGKNALFGTKNFYQQLKDK
ncbi:MAG TPA: DUF1835 domain-containing protein, partial [Salinimicrobium sp.]|nr:DUF1835 domain-containing protein [Salinimicrobium sp.]